MSLKLITVSTVTPSSSATPSLQPSVAPDAPKKGHVLSDEDRRKGGLASAAKRKAAKEARLQAKREASAKAPVLASATPQLQDTPKAEVPADPMRWYRNEVHATWNYYTSAPAENVYEFAHAETDAAGFAVSLGLKLAGLKLIESEGYQYVLCLRHRATGCFVLVFATKSRLAFASTFQDPSKVPAEVTQALSTLFDQVSK